MKKYVLWALAALSLFACGVLVGRNSLPARVELVKEKTEIHNTTQQIDTEALVTQIAKLVQERSEKRNVTGTREIIREGGKEIIKETFKDLTETNERIESNTETLTELRTQLKLMEEKLSLEREIKIAIAQTEPDMRFGLLLGYNFASLFGRHDAYNLVPVRGVVAQLQLEKRLTEPMWILPSIWGVAWAQSTLAGGIGLKAEWK